MRIPSRRILAAAVVTTSLILAGCSSGSDDDSSTTGSSASSAADSSSGSSSGASEVTIQHVWGEATYPTKPAKVISIGTATDNLLALGIVPDAIVERPDDEDAVWKNDQLEGVERIGLSDRDMPIEAIAKLEPDLIVGDLYRINEDQYKTLKDIAPTLPGIDKSVDWAPQLEALAKIYDREDKAREIVEADEKAFAAARDRLPGLKGKTALTVQDRSGQFGVIADPENIANRFYSRLGMTLPKPFTDNSVQVNQGRAQISYERVSDLAANFMGIYATEGMDKIHGIAGYDQLPQVSSGAVVQDNKAVMAALNVPSSLSNAWLLEQLGDQLKIAADADPVEAV